MGRPTEFACSAAMAALLLTACSGAPDMREVAQACESPGVISGGERYLSLQGANDDGTGLACIADELSMPESVVEAIETKRESEPQQSSEWGTFYAVYQVHPDGSLVNIAYQPAR